MPVLLKSNLSSLIRPWLPLKKHPICLVKEGGAWAIDTEIDELGNMLQQRSCPVQIISKTEGLRNRIIHYPAIYMLLDDLKQVHWSNRLTVSWLHGQSADIEFEKRFRIVRQHHRRISKIHVTNSSFQNYVLATGISPSKVVSLPLGINLNHFSPSSLEKRETSRKKLGIPQNAFVIGSFQKDGEGWQEGLKPKLIKGPDLFIEVIEKIARKKNNLHFLLSGPARAYIKNRLE
jgi:glycosyltransferase involved in cell wall biosynthesis